jgi:hypothetical protein
MCVSPWKQVAVFCIPETGAVMYSKHVTVKRFLKKVLIVAYPDHNHRLRHLERVYGLWWNSDAVDFYIREYHKLVATLTAAVMQGTYNRGTNPLGRAKTGHAVAPPL